MKVIATEKAMSNNGIIASLYLGKREKRTAMKI